MHVPPTSNPSSSSLLSSPPPSRHNLLHIASVTLVFVLTALDRPPKNDMSRVAENTREARDFVCLFFAIRPPRSHRSYPVTVPYIHLDWHSTQELHSSRRVVWMHHCLFSVTTDFMWFLSFQPKRSFLLTRPNPSKSYPD
jgi:hypothetical protein